MTSEVVTDDDRERLRKHFSVPEEEHSNQWSTLWEDNYLPWDKGAAGPSLIDLLASPAHKNLFSSENGSKKALVPGCGRGYDVVLFAQHGYDAYGVDVAVKAIESAKEYAIQEKQQDRARFLVGDFFKNGFCEEAGVSAGEWDLVYDYTFLCALPPTLRTQWAARMSGLLKSGGLLVCLEFPLYKDLNTGGPPWGLTSEVYVELLEMEGMERIVHEKPTRFSCHLEGHRYDNGMAEEVNVQKVFKMSSILSGKTCTIHL